LGRGTLEERFRRGPGMDQVADLGCDDQQLMERDAALVAGLVTRGTPSPTL
jgi:hypothetical protein